MVDESQQELLNTVLERQNALIEEVRSLRKSSRKDFWDILGAVAPIIAAGVIALGGTYFTWTYNQQQLKLQQIQTIEKFIPHLLGDEKSKRAAILAISSLGDDKLASRMASIFASPGTASALESMAKNSNGPDNAVVTNALYKTLDALASGYQTKNQFDDAIEAYKKALEIKEQVLGNNSPQLAGDLDKLAALYDAHNNHDLAQPLHDRANNLRAASAQPVTPATVVTPLPSSPSQESKPVPEEPLPHMNAADKPAEPAKAESPPEQKSVKSGVETETSAAHEAEAASKK